MTLRGDLLSVVTPNRNRLSTLLRVIPTWQRCEQVGEIVVVDLGSDRPIALEHFESTQKIRIVRAVNADCWRIGLAINLGVDHASHEAICKLDSDIEIRDGAALAAGELSSAFYRGRAGTSISNGQVLFSRQHWAAVGGYNEWLSGYGYDDSDFYARLRRSGLSERDLAAHCLAEYSHSNETRAATDLRTEFFTLTLPNADARLLYMLSRNTYLGMLRRWSPDLRLPYRRRQLPDGTLLVELEAMSDDYRWADAFASMLAVVRVSGTQDNVNVLNSLVGRHLAEIGGL